MALCVPQVMILDHPFVRRLRGNLENHFDDRAKSNFDLEDVKVRLFGVGGRTFKKIKQFDEANVSRFAPDDGMFFMAFIGTGILYVSATCVVCQAIPAIVQV